MHKHFVSFLDSLNTPVKNDVSIELMQYEGWRTEPTSAIIDFAGGILSPCSECVKGLDLGTGEAQYKWIGGGRHRFLGAVRLTPMH